MCKKMITVQTEDSYEYDKSFELMLSKNLPIINIRYFVLINEIEFKKPIKLQLIDKSIIVTYQSGIEARYKLSRHGDSIDLYMQVITIYMKTDEVKGGDS